MKLEIFVQEGGVQQGQLKLNDGAKPIGIPRTMRDITIIDLILLHIAKLSVAQKPYFGNVRAHAVRITHAARAMCSQSSDYGLLSIQPIMLAPDA